MYAFRQPTNLRLGARSGARRNGGGAAAGFSARVGGMVGEKGASGRRRRVSHPGRRTLRGFGFSLLLALLALTGVSPVSLAAQSGLAEAEARYETALAAYRQVLEARDRALQQHDILMDRQEDARRSGDEERAQEAMRRVHEQGVQVMLLDQQLRGVASELQAAGQRYLAELDAREEQLLDRIEETVLPGPRAALDRELSEVRARYREVERESGSPALGELRPLPDVAIDRRDGPEELRGKAGILESRAVEYDSVIVDLEREIASRERRLQQERGREDLIAGISRFDDDVLTGGGLTPPSDQAGSESADSGTPVNLAELSRPDQLVLLREYLTLAQGLRDEALARARVFRERAEGGIP